MTPRPDYDHPDRVGTVEACTREKRALQNALRRAKRKGDERAMTYLRARMDRLSAVETWLRRQQPGADAVSTLPLRFYRK